MPADFAIMTAYVNTLVAAGGLTDQQIGILLNLSHREEVEGYPWARLQTDFAFNTTAIISAGTITGTQGSPLIIGTGTAWTSAMTGYQFRPGTSTTTATNQLVPIRIDSVQDATHLTLSDPYPFVTQSGLGYQIFQMFYSVLGVQRVIGIRQQTMLGRRTHGWVNAQDPYRYQQSSPARFWYPFGQNHNGDAIISLWPTETNANPYTCYGLKGHLDLKNPDDTPLIPSAVVIQKTLMKSCEAIIAANGDERWFSMRDFYDKRYQFELAKAIESDREEFGVVSQVQDSTSTPDSEGFHPTIDQYYNRDIGER